MGCGQLNKWSRSYRQQIEKINNQSEIECIFRTMLVSDQMGNELPKPRNAHDEEQFDDDDKVAFGF